MLKGDRMIDILMSCNGTERTRTTGEREREREGRKERVIMQKMFVHLQLAILFFFVRSFVNVMNIRVFQGPFCYLFKVNTRAQLNRFQCHFSLKREIKAAELEEMSLLFFFRLFRKIKEQKGGAGMKYHAILTRMEKKKKIGMDGETRLTSTFSSITANAWRRMERPQHLKCRESTSLPNPICSKLKTNRSIERGERRRGNSLLNGRLEPGRAS